MIERLDFFDTKKNWWKLAWCLLPKNGNDAVSALAKTDGGPNNTTEIESKNDEWGAKTKIGASFDVAWRPVIFTWWNEPKNHMPYIVRAANIWITLKSE